MHSEPEVMIIGAGPVGLVTALALARRGVSALVVDDGARTAARSYAVGIHPTSLDLLARLGVQSALAARGLRVDGIYLYDAGEQRRWASLAGLPAEHSHVLALSQAALEEELAAALAAAGVRVCWSHRVTSVRGEGAPVVQLERLAKESGPFGGPPVWTVADRCALRPRFVVGADGHGSLVRKSLRVELEERGPARRYLAVEVTSRSSDAGHDLRLLLDDERADAIWPLPGGAFRCSLELPAGAEEESRFKERALWAPHPAVDDELAALVSERVPWIGAGTPIRWSGVARFERRLARSYGAGAVWLAGDAAHTTSPLGVQSLNMGLREGVALAAALVEALGGDRRRLAAYEPTFRREWALLHGATPVVSADPWLRRMGPRLLAALPATGEPLAHLLRRLGAELDTDPARIVRAS